MYLSDMIYVKKKIIIISAAILNFNCTKDLVREPSSRILNGLFSAWT